MQVIICNVLLGYDLSDPLVVTRLFNSVEFGSAESVRFALNNSHSKFLCSILFGEQGSALVELAFHRRHWGILLALLGNKRSNYLFAEASQLEHAGNLRDAMNKFGEGSSIIGSHIEQCIIDQSFKSQVFLPGLAGKYRLLAELLFDSNEFSSVYPAIIENACKLNMINPSTNRCQLLWWTKGVALQKLGRHQEAFSMFESLVTMSSPFYASCALYELGLYDEALHRLKDVVLDSTSKNVLCLAQVSRCLMRLGNVSTQARRTYQRLRVFGVDKYFEQQKLSKPEVAFVRQVLKRLKAFLDTTYIPPKIEAHSAFACVKCWLNKFGVEQVVISCSYVVTAKFWMKQHQA
eukprot:TRINITY_DN10288_c0_g1_i11.p1 TRINITY_DN10288_c0_g1~~TRINITY_DN10288_c0_g1_i11.p1  ORF type:complete len:349 (+),score=69.28 TRINITY_DN10288_c0_g1_i11:887-1933(+)